MEEAEENLLTAPPRRSILWAILAVVSGFTLLWMFSGTLSGGPTSNGMTVSEWLNATNQGHIWEGNSSEHVEPIIKEFGPEAIPLFISEFNGAHSKVRSARTWLYENVPGMGRPRVAANHIQNRSFRALAILGQTHPELVDPFFEKQLLTTNRHLTMTWMGISGVRHFNFLTNLINGTNPADAGAAISALGGMGTNAHSAVPLVFSTLEKHGATGGRYWWINLWVIPRIGKDHEMTLPTLLPMLEHTNQHARINAGYALLRMTNHYEQIRPEIIRLSRLPITSTNDPGKYVAHRLAQLGVPPEVGVPILMERLKYMIKLDGHVPDPNSQTRRWLSWMEIYGTNAAPVIKLIEDEVLHLHPPRPRGERTMGGGRLRWEIEKTLLRIDPSWTPP